MTTIFAVLLVAGKALLSEPPTDRIAAYEKAPGTLHNWFDVGPNRIRMRLVTRNERDGTLKYENGRGVAIQNLTALNAPILSSAAPWLDVVQIELEPTPDRVDVIEARVFDHKTRTLINATDPALGWRMAAPDILQIYGLGKPVPDELDVWFRLQSYPANEQRIGTLDPTPKSSCRLPDSSEFTLNDIRNSLDGGWTSAKGFLASPKPDGDQVVGDFTISHGHDRLSWQMAAILKSGERIHPDSRHFVSPQVLMLKNHRELITFDADLLDVDHFEVRPFGGRERFFFDSVTLPRVASKAFTQPPVVQINIDGREIDEQITAFEPLVVRVETFRGLTGNGSFHSLRRGSIGHRSIVPDLNRAFTFESTVTGLRMRLDGHFTLKASQPQSGGMQRTGFSGDASGGTIRATSAGYMTPLDQVESVEVQLRP